MKDLLGRRMPTDRKILPMVSVDGRRLTAMAIPTQCKFRITWPGLELVLMRCSNNYIYNTVEQLLENLDLESLHVPQVAHRGHANGLVLKHKSGWKVV